MTWNLFRSALLLLFFANLVSLGGCSRDVDPAIVGATLKFSIPKSQKVDTQSISTLFDQDKACFAIGISGPGVSSSNNDSLCSKNSGKLAGMIRPTSSASESSIEFQNIPFGSNREVTIYAYDIPAGMGACPKVNSDSFGSIPRDKIYIVGKSNLFAIDRAVVEVSVSIALPTVDEPVSQVWNLPATCPKLQAAGKPPESPVGFRTVIQTGGPFVVQSSTRILESKKLSGGPFEVHLKGR